MKRIISILSIALALLAQSCDRRPIIVEDLSKVREVKLNVDTNADPWLAGESRRFRIEVMPETAMATDFEMHVSDESLLEVSKGAASNEFIVTAIAGGTKLGETYASVFASVGGVESPKQEYCLIDKRPKPTAPEFTLSYADAAKPGKKQSISSVMKTYCLHHYSLTIDFADKKGTDDITVQIDGLDKEIAKIERTGSRTWMVSALKPGKTQLSLNVADGKGNEFTFEYTLVSYGHITLDAEFFTPAGYGGYNLRDYPYESTMAHIHINAFILANIHDLSARAITKEKDFNFYVPIDDEDNNMMLDCRDILEEIYCNYAYDAKGQRVPYHPVEARLTYVFTLDNPYIIIDDVTDDLDRDEQKYSDVSIIAFFQQEGIETFDAE